jgi:prephenate dehydrogenase
MDVLVVGAGAMGRWLGAVFASADGSQATRRDVSVSYYDQDLTVAEQAASETGGQALASLAERQFDVVGIAVPIPAVSDAIAAHAGRARGAVLDVSGVMTDPVAALETHTTDQEWASLHPLFAPANEPGNVPVVLGNEGSILADLWATLETRGNTVFETTPTEHDAAMETVQARAHAVILAYGLASESVPERFQTPVSQRLEELLAQVAGGDPRVYADIQAAFDGADDVAAAAETLASASSAEFETLYTDLLEDRHMDESRQTDDGETR